MLSHFTWIAEKLNKYCGLDLGQGLVHIQRLIAKAKRKQQNFVISVTMATLMAAFPLNEQNSILSLKGK